MLALPDDAARAPKLRSTTSTSARCRWRTATRAWRARFYGEDGAARRRARRASARRSTPTRALALGLVTVAPDDIDWDDELRIAIEERAAHLARRADRHGGEPALRRPGDHGDARSSAGSPPGRTGSSSAPTPPARRARSRSTAPARRPASTSTASERADEHPETRRHGHRLHRRRSRTTSTSPTTARCSARSSSGSRTSSTGGTTSGPRARPTTTSTCAPRSASTRRLGALRLREDAATTAGASSSTPAEPSRKIDFGDHIGEPAWQEVPGEHRATCAASSSRRATPSRRRSSSSASSATPRRRSTTCATSSRSTSRKAATCGRWSTCCTSYFGRDGREEAEELLERRSGDADKPRILGAFNEPTPDWLAFFMFTMFTDRDGKFQLAALAESGFDPLARTTQVHADRGSAPHVRRRDRRVARRCSAPRR